MSNKSIISKTITNIEHIMYGQGFPELIRRVSRDEQSPVQHTVYFSHLPEGVLKNVHTSEIDSALTETMTKSRRGLAKVLYASMCSFIFASTNVVAYTRMMSSFRTINDRLSTFLLGKKGRELLFETDSRKKVVPLYRELEKKVNATENILNALARFPTEPHACETFSALCNEYDQLIEDSQEALTSIGITPDELWDELYIEYGCHWQRKHLRDYSKIRSELVTLGEGYGMLNPDHENMMEQLYNEGLNVYDTAISMNTLHTDLPPEIKSIFETGSPQINSLIAPVSLSVNSREKTCQYSSMIKSMFERLVTSSYNPTSIVDGSHQSLVVYCPKSELSNLIEQDILKQQFK